MNLVIAPDSPTSPDCEAMLTRHLRFAHEVTPPDHVHALDIELLLQPDISFYGARREGHLVGVAALRDLGDGHGEIKSMHVATTERGHGVGAALVEHLLATARNRGWSRVSLETGSEEAFAPARRLYSATGFAICRPFGDYTDNVYSVCMTIEL